MMVTVLFAVQRFTKLTKAAMLNSAMRFVLTRRVKRCKIYYITQGSVAPPTFILFVNDKKLMHFSYVRYLENCIRTAMDFSGTPIKLIIKSKMEKDV